MFHTIYIHQFGWLSEREGNFLNFFQRDGGTQKGEGSLRNRVWGGGGTSNPGGNYGEKKTQKEQKKSYIKLLIIFIISLLI